MYRSETLISTNTQTETPCIMILSKGVLY